MISLRGTRAAAAADRLLHFQRGQRELGEPLGEVGRALVGVIGRAVVEQVPDDLDADLFGRLEHRQPARPVVFARALFDQMPAQPVAERAEAELACIGIVARDVPVVPGRPDQVEPDAVAAPVRRAFEPGHEETVEIFGAHIFLRRKDLPAAVI